MYLSSGPRRISEISSSYIHTLMVILRVDKNNAVTFLARLDEVQEELLYYPRRRRWRRRRLRR